MLPFLARFKDFLDSLADGRKRDAAKILIACFGEGLVPEGFMAVLLMDSLTFLEGKFHNDSSC